MEHLDAFIVQLALLLLPGIVWARLDARYAAKERSSEFDFVLRAFVYGLASYVVTFALYSGFGLPFAFIDVEEAQATSIITAQIAAEIATATAVGFILGVVWVYASTWKVLPRLLQWIRATKRYGDEDVWDFTFNSTAPKVRFVNVRDFDKKVVYAGWVSAFSESGKLRELTLSEVQVYDFDGQFMFDTPNLYLARKPDDIHIEFPYRDRTKA